MKHHLLSFLGRSPACSAKPFPNVSAEGMMCNRWPLPRVQLGGFAFIGEGIPVGLGAAFRSKYLRVRLLKQIIIGGCPIAQGEPTV